MHKFDRNFLLLLFDKLFDFLTIFYLSIVLAYLSFLSFFLRLRDIRLLLFHLLRDLVRLCRYLLFKEIEQKLRMGLFQIFIFIVSRRSSFLRNRQKYQRHRIFPQLRRMLHLKNLHYSRLLTFGLLFQEHKIMNGKGLSHYLKSGNNANLYM